MTEVGLIDVVELRDDLPAEGLCRGQLRTIVDDFQPDRFLVEFSDDDGRTIVESVLRADQVRLAWKFPGVESQAPAGGSG